jgi:PIN domain nuclease of toxin-antitoxin system
MKFVAVADTHAVLWYLLNDPRLSTAARDVFDLADSTKNSIVLSPISLVEVTYLVEKNRIPELAYTLLVNALAEPDNLFVEAPLPLRSTGHARPNHRGHRAALQYSYP